ncbi:MAG: hypothetical protein AAF539_04995, partial [Planctomycetota bacterium]
SIEAEMQNLEEGRTESLDQLARHYLPDLTPESISQTWTDVRPAIRDVLLRKQHQAQQWEDELKSDNTLRRGQEEQLIQIAVDIESAEQQQASASSAVEVQLQSDPEFVQLSDRAAMAEAALQRAEANLDEVSQDAARKLPAFDECKLFSYLRQRGYGTSAYTKRGFTRRMDRMLAGMTNYSKAKRDYDFLTTTPDTMREIIAQDRAALETVLDELTRLRDLAAQQHRLPEAIAEVQRHQEIRADAIAALDETNERCEATLAKLNELQSPQCEFYIEAIGIFRSMLARLDASDLRRQARVTPEITDDQIVASLRGLDQQIDQQELATSQRGSELEQTQAVHTAIGRLVQRFRAAGFDVARCHFSETLDVVGQLDRARHDHDVDAVWQSIRRAQSWGPTTMDKVTAVATHPMTQVLVNAMAHAAAGALRDNARRAGRRRRRHW